MNQFDNQLNISQSQQQQQDYLFQTQPMPNNVTFSNADIDNNDLSIDFNDPFDSQPFGSSNDSYNPPSSDDFESWVNDLFVDPDYGASISSPASLAPDDEVTKPQFVAPAPAPILLADFKPPVSNGMKKLIKPTYKKNNKYFVNNEDDDGEDEDYEDHSSTGKKRGSNIPINELYNENRNTASTRLRKKLKGVTYHPESKRYRSRIKIGTRTTHLGYFFTEEGAAKAYDRAATEIRGSRASTNFPVETGTYYVPPGSPRSRCIAAAKTVMEDHKC